ncbi:MAG: hypothetical protein GY838_08050 [bacterium]|nr:hypothetical protein [bacterium]
MPRLILVLLLVPLLLSSARADEDWAIRVLRLDPGLLLEITTDDGAVHTGFPAPAAGDSVGLAAISGQPAREALAAGEILLVRQQRSTSARGWRTGSTIGAASGGVLGLLFALAASDLADENTIEGTVAPFAGMTIGSASVGATIVGSIGALIGSGSETWYDLDVRAAVPLCAWRLEPQLGMSAADDIGGDKYDDLHLRLFVPRRLKSWLEAGPDVGWMRLGTYREHWSGRAASVHDTGHAGATARVTLPAGGIEPFVSLGLGWYHRENSWLGTAIGMGVRSGRATAEVRSHHRSSGAVDPQPTNDMLTVTVGWAFDL